MGKEMKMDRRKEKGKIFLTERRKRVRLFINCKPTQGITKKQLVGNTQEVLFLHGLYKKGIEMKYDMKKHS